MESFLTTAPAPDELEGQLHLDIESLEPPEDAGSDTLSRYRYQAELAVRPCLAMLAGEAIERVICEWHEDYVVSTPNARTQLISVKHLEETQPRWTVRGLCFEGGVAHLFKRWRAAGQRVTCLLQTNSGMRAASNEPADLKRCCAAGDTEGLERWATILRPHIAESCNSHTLTILEVRTFLGILRIEDALPGRQDIEARNLQEYVPKALAGLNIPATRHRTMYHRLVDEVIRASSGAGQEDVLATLADPTRLDADSLLRGRVAAKTLDRQRLLRALTPSGGQDTHLINLHAESRTPSKLQSKLTKGGFGPTAIRNARNLRMNWLLHLHRWTIGLPDADAEFGNIRARVLDVAAAAENRTRVPGGLYGPAMMEEIRARFSDHSDPISGLSSVDGMLLFGCAFDLTEDCEIWWSDHFDPGGKS